MDSFRHPLLLATTIICATPAVAQTIYIEANWSCAEWARSRSDADTHLEQFLLGLFNGAAMGTGKDFWGTEPKIAPAQAFFWMDQYCANNPLNYLFQGGFDLLEERLGKGWNVNGSN